MTFLRAKLRRSSSAVDLRSFKTNLMYQAPQNLAELIRAVKLLDPEEQKDYFAFVLEKKQLKNLVHNEYDLRNFCKENPKASTFIFKALGKDFLQSIVWRNEHQDPEWIRDVIEVLPAKARIVLLRDYLGGEFIAQRLTHPDYLSRLIGYLEPDDVKILLNDILSLDFLKKLINDGFGYVRGIPEDFHPLIIERLGYRHIGKKIATVFYYLKEILKLIPEEKRLSFLYDDVGIRHLRGYMRKENMGELLNMLPENDRDKINTSLNPFLMTNLKDSQKRIIKRTHKYETKDGKKIYEAIPLNDELEVGLAGEGWGYSEIAIYNAKTSNILQKLDIGKPLRHLFVIDKNNFGVHYRNTNALMLMAWDEKQQKILKKDQILIPLNQEEREEITYAYALPKQRLLVVVSDNMNVVNNYKSWTIRICDLRYNKDPELVLTVPRDEHFWVKNMTLTPSGILIGWSEPWHTEDTHKLCFIDTKDFTAQSIKLPLADHLKITDVSVDESGKVLVELNEGPFTMEFDLQRRPFISEARSLFKFLDEKSETKPEIVMPPKVVQKIKTPVSPTLFAKADVDLQKKPDLPEKLVSDEEMANSDFGQASNTAVSFRR